MILLAADGLSNDEIAGRLDTRREVVSMCASGSLKTASPVWRSDHGRDAPGLFPPTVVQVKALACELPVTPWSPAVALERGRPCNAGPANPDSSPGSAIARSGVGSMRMRSALGATAVGSFLAMDFAVKAGRGSLPTHLGRESASAMTRGPADEKTAVCRPGTYDGMPLSRLSPARSKEGRT